MRRLAVWAICILLVAATLAGAAETMEEALLVNPYDLDATAAALEQALTMPRPERRRRMDALRRREAGQDVRPLNVVTRDLRVQPKHNYAETDQPATLISGENRIDTVGVQAWFSTPAHFKFLSRVRGHYEVH